MSRVVNLQDEKFKKLSSFVFSSAVLIMGQYIDMKLPFLKGVLKIAIAVEYTFADMI